MNGEPRRRYASPRRVQQAAQTRTAVLDAARELFAERGWSATGMRDIATRAGVSVETIYANFGSKTDLLLVVVDIGVVGDDRPVPLADRPEFAALGQGNVTQRLRAAAKLARGINERTFRMQMVLREAASGDPDVAKRLRAADQRRRVTVVAAAQLLIGRKVTDIERDGIWAVAGAEVYELLVDRSGWSTKRYEQWLADTIAGLLGLTEKDSR